jgi:phosphate-induced protein 1
MRRAIVGSFAVSCLAFAVSTAVDAASVLASDEELVPTGKGWGERPAPGPGPGQGMGQGQGQPQGQGKPTRNGGNGISYHGGPIIQSPSVYYIWYGNWSGNTATSILPDLASNLTGSPYFNINTTYYDGSNNKVMNYVAYQGSTTDDYSRGTTLNDAGVQSVVADAINAGRLHYDASAVYFVLTSADVNESSGFCTQYCGWHTHASITGIGEVRYAFVGNPDRCPSACAAQTTGPNGNAGADAMASIIAHELEEAATDPNLNAWYDQRGQENADKCAWTFGTQYVTANGAKANMKLGSRDYLIQQNWVNVSGGYCSVSY